MEGVTTAIVAFLFVCIVFPTVVKNKPQYYAAFAAIVVVILLSGLAAVVSSAAFHGFAAFMTALLQALAMILLTLSAGGLSWKQLAGEVSEAIEVVRRGETKKEVIIPLRGDEPFLRAPFNRTGSKASADASVPAPRVVLDDSEPSVPLE